MSKCRNKKRKGFYFLGVLMLVLAFCIPVSAGIQEGEGEYEVYPTPHSVDYEETATTAFVNWFSSYQNDSMSIPYYPATQEEIDQFMALYNAAEGTSDYDVNLMSIITEQAGAYFAGDRSLDDTVSAIQSRVGLYLAELQ